MVTRKGFFVCLLLSLLGCQSLFAQRIINELESNTGTNLGDSMLEGDSLDTKKKAAKKVVPADVRSWTIDPDYGNPTDVDVDTLHHHFQNSDLPEGLIGEYNPLGNIGSPRLSRIYMNRTVGSEFIFTHPFDQFLVAPGDFRHYNTKSPYMNLTYNWCGSKQSGDDHFRALYTNNAGKRINFGGIFDYMYGPGYYDNQATSFMGSTGFGSYTSDRYDLHFHYTHNYMKLSENGGIEDDQYITNPEGMAQRYGSNDIPTNLSDNFMKQEHDIVRLNHRYHIGFTRTEGDSTDLHDVFVPVTSFFHTFSFESYRRAYQTKVANNGFHTYQFLPSDTVNDRNKMLEIRNLIGVSLNEGFNKYAVAGLNAYVGFLHRTHTMTDTIPGVLHTRLSTVKYDENDVLVGGQMIRTQGTWIHYNADVKFVVAGDNAGDMRLTGRGELNMPLLGDTAQVVLHALLSRENPNFYFDHYHSTYAWWDNDMRRTTQTRLGADIVFPKTGTRLSFAMENLKNYAYFANNGTALYDEEGNITSVSNNAVARQYNDNIQIISARLQQNFKFGPLHFDNDITYQTSTKEDILPLPKLSTYHNLYLSFLIAKVLNCELGADMKYFTKYYAPDYSPVIGQFTTQNPNKRMKIGDYPMFSVYANFLLKRCRFYIQYYHANQSDGRYFWAPHYPMNPSGIHFGISWNFYD